MAWVRFQLFLQLRLYSNYLSMRLHALVDEGWAQGLTEAAPLFVAAAMVSFVRRIKVLGLEEIRSRTEPVKRWRNF
jgi:hypothetical protein